MTRIVDGLEQASLAERRPHPQDGRATLVRATKKGRRVMERGRQRRVELITTLLGGCPTRTCSAWASSRSVGESNGDGNAELMHQWQVSDSSRRDIQAAPQRRDDPWSRRPPAAVPPWLPATVRFAPEC